MIAKISNIVIITSIINIPTYPLNYTNTRSVYTPEERFEQTRLTIHSIRANIPDSRILIVECSNLSDIEMQFFKESCDYVVNLVENIDVRLSVYSKYKSLGERAFTMSAINWLNENNIQYDALYKISGRYWINDQFKCDFSPQIVVRGSPVDTSICTILYKIPRDVVAIWYEYLVESYTECMQYGFEEIFGKFINVIKDAKDIKIKYIPVIGVSGNIAVDGSEIHF